MAGFAHRNLKSSICFERNLTSRFKRTLNFDSAHRFLSNIEDVAQTIFHVFFFFFLKTSVSSSFQREIPCFRLLIVSISLQKRLYSPKHE